MPVWRHFHSTTPEMPKMKLLRPQLSSPGPFSPRDGSAEFHSSARKTARPGKLMHFSSAWDFPCFLISFYLNLVLVSSAGQYWSSANDSLPALPSIYLQNMAPPWPWGSTRSTGETVTTFRPSMSAYNKGNIVLLSVIPYTRATDPFHTWPHVTQQMEQIPSTLYELKSPWKLTQPDPLILFKAHNIQEQHIPFKSHESCDSIGIQTPSPLTFSDSSSSCSTNGDHFN